MSVRVSVTDNFFDLGGDSLLVAKLLVRIEQLFGKQLSMTTLFQAPTIRAISRHSRTSGSFQRFSSDTGSACRITAPVFLYRGWSSIPASALRLGTDRPFLSLMPSLLPELKQLSAPCHLEQIAVSLANSILDYQNERPILPRRLECLGSSGISRPRGN